MSASDRTYIVHPALDCLMLGGLSILAFGGLALFHSGARTPGVIHLAALLMWVINWPHFAATSYRLYGSRESLAAYPVTALATPLIAVLGVAASLVDPERVAPAFVKLFLLWSPYHFSGQTLGLSLLYAGRAGFRVGPWERRIMTGFIYGTFLGMTARGELGRQTVEYFGVSYPTFGIPDLLAKALLWSCYAFGAAFLGLAARWFLDRERRPPLILLVIPAAQFFWFMPGVGTASFYEFVPLFHSLQYLYVAWALNLRESIDQGLERPGVAGALRATGRWAVASFLGGVVLFWAFPRLAAWVSGRDLALAEGVVLAGVQIHHFFVDGVIWRLRTPRLRESLAVTWGDVAGAARRAGVAALVLLGLAGGALAGGPGAGSGPPRIAGERVLLHTTLGDLLLVLYPEVAPRHVEALLERVRAGAYDGVRFHRVHPGFVVQLAEVEDRRWPLTDAQRALLHTLPAEFSDVPHRRGVLSMARWDDPDSARTSFSILLGDAPHLDGKYTVFGTVERGFATLRAMERVPVDGTFTPRERLAVRAARVVPASAARTLELEGPPPERPRPAPEVEAARGLRDRVLAGVFGAVALLGVLVSALAPPGGVVVASLGMLVTLVAFFAALVLLLPMEGSGVGALLFLGSLGVVRWMSEFEREVPGEGRAIPKPRGADPVRPARVRRRSRGWRRRRRRRAPRRSPRGRRRSRRG